MKHPIYAISFLVAACTPTVQTTNTTVAGGTPPNAERMATDIKTLSSDAFLGRGPATRGEELATTYIRDRLIAAGVQPGGPNGSWFQDVPLVKADISGTPSLSYSVNGQTTQLGSRLKNAIFCPFTTSKEILLNKVLPSIFLESF
ncbi:MAG TPA: hypothetical protein VM099_01750 [Gemmatimonadaceae bacterium]|nr:hypothetical protein [Gemmatimonadaceae bacterium]